jgi:hypothetical protein
MRSVVPVDLDFDVVLDLGHDLDSANVVWRRFCAS